MRIHVAVLLVAVAVAGCKKKGTTDGGGGGGGGWLIGSAGLMVNVHDDMLVGEYDLGSDVNLNAIACRYLAEAWVVGDDATVLYTKDGGESWLSQTVPATARLRTLATQDDGPVFLGGDGTFLVTLDTGKTWTSLGDGVTSFRSMSAAQASTGVLALSEDGGLWSYEAGTLTRRSTVDGARAVHQTPDGEVIMTAGAGIARSLDGGVTWRALDVDPSIVFDDLRVNLDGTAVAVGANGAIATVGLNGAVAVQYVGDKGLHTIHIHDDEMGYAGGDDGQVLITEDSGLTWRIGPNVERTVRGVDGIGFNHR
ncbi:MAG TPA: YCF48-related protein [Kofleriaceae bacterium]